MSKRTISKEAIGGGKDCDGDKMKIEKCNESPCPGMLDSFIIKLKCSWFKFVFKVLIKKLWPFSYLHFLENCQWSDFDEWSECSKSCGGGEKTSKRKIIKHALYGGRECEGDDIKIEYCNEQPCPGILKYQLELHHFIQKKSTKYTNPVISINHILVDCMWSEYGEWSECSVTCGKGHKTATRKVIREAQSGGMKCEGTANKTTTCEHKKCKGIWRQMIPIYLYYDHNNTH